ncbi:MAG: PAS domain S-box protein [Archaeoglobus sp.]|uniref:PAS domain S-box protein n=1 Tax=Archaeoglobus sp. TaxID=1872626 RepID=UPI001D940BE6|nr:PAS domain S-box protein [Archaeoglobus sp.]MBO8179998.1 PAS domain S-box protein [Archaeoglobus sp.]
MKKHILIITFVLLLIPNSALALKVGVYDNPPMVFVEDGEARGFFIDILEYIADREGWKVEYVYDSFPNLLERLERGELDLVVDVAYTEERAEKFSFNKEVIFTNWGVIVGKEELNSILKLDGLKVAGVKRDVYTEELKELVDGFNIKCQILEIEGDYKDVMEEIVAGRADAGVVSRIYASLYAEDYGLRESELIFGPVELRFAGKDEAVLEKIDEHLAALKSDRNSIYHQSLDRWLGPKVEVVPGWVYYALAALFAVLIAALGLNAYLGRVVAKRTEEIKRNEEFLKAVFDAIQDGISVLDTEMNVIMVNHAMEKWYGNVVGKKCYEAYHNRKEPCENCPTIEAMKTGEMKRGEHQTPIGTPIEWVELFSYPVIEDGKVKMVVEFVRDITERKRMEDKLRRSLESYEYLWNSTNDILYVHDLEGRFIKVNRRALELLGYKEGEDVSVWDVVPEPYHDLVREKIRKIVETKTPTEPYEIPVKAKNGNVLWLEVVSHPVIEGNEAVAIHGVARDVTDRRKLIEEIGENIKLVSYLVDRIRNPLAAARAFCELREKLGDDVYGRVISNIDRVTELIADLDRVWENLERLRKGLKK